MKRPTWKAKVWSRLGGSWTIGLAMTVGDIALSAFYLACVLALFALAIILAVHMFWRLNEEWKLWQWVTGKWI